MDPTMKQMVTSMFKALGIWMGLYIVLAHCFVVWNWDSVGVTSKNATAATPAMLYNETAIQEYETLLYQLQSARIQAEERLERVQAQRAGLQATMATMEAKTATMTNAALVSSSPSSSWSSHHEENPEALDAWKFLSVLNVTDLSLYQMDKQLDKWILSCIETLEQIIENGNTTDWRALNQRLRNTLDKEDINISSCPAAAGSARRRRAAAGIKRIPRQAVADWQEQTRQELEYLLQSLDDSQEEDDEEEASGTLPLRWDSTVEDIQDALQEKLSALQHEWLQQASNETTAAASTTSSSNHQQGTCVAHATDVLPWLEAGLEAQSRRRDVRNAILEAMQLDDIDTSKIILDAVLTDDRDMMPKRDKTTTTSLRTLLDGPWIKTLAEALDALLDKTSGHVDIWDQFLDDLVASGASPSSASSSWQGKQQPLLGQVAVQYLLQAAGHVPFTTDVLPALVAQLKKVT